MMHGRMNVKGLSTHGMGCLSVTCHRRGCRSLRFIVVILKLTVHISLRTVHITQRCTYDRQATQQVANLMCG